MAARVLCSAGRASFFLDPPSCDEVSPCAPPQVLDRMRQEQVVAEVRSRAVEESLRATGKEHERLLITSKETQHAREQAKQVRVERGACLAGGVRECWPLEEDGILT